MVELGAGIGLLGLCAAVTGAHVLLTDVPAVVDNVLRPNLAANTGQSPLEGARAWSGARCVGAGSATAQTLDWYRPLVEQSVPLDPMEADVVLAAECVWLKELVEPFIATVRGLREFDLSRATAHLSLGHESPHISHTITHTSPSSPTKLTVPFARTGPWLARRTPPRRLRARLSRASSDHVAVVRLGEHGAPPL